MGYGSGPVFAAGLMVGGAVLFAGWAIGHMATSDEGLLQAFKGERAVAAPAPAPDPVPAERDGTVTVTLADKNENGIPDAFERQRDPGRPPKQPASGPVDSDDPAPKPKTKTYIIRWGDTLTGISAETGVPIGHLVELNKIQDPDLIYAGAALLIPQVD